VFPHLQRGQLLRVLLRRLLGRCRRRRRRNLALEQGGLDY